MYRAAAKRDIVYINGVDSFVKAARAYDTSDGYVYCPCFDCRNQKQFGNIEQIRCHLLCRGFMENYKIWNKHGEEGENESTQQTSREKSFQEATKGVVLEPEPEPSHTQETFMENICDTMDETLAAEDVVDGIDQMIRDAEPECLDAKNLKKLQQMRKDAKTPLYHGCSMSKLEADLLLLEMKSANGVSDTGFDNLLDLLQKMLPSQIGRAHV